MQMRLRPQPEEVSRALGAADEPRLRAERDSAVQAARAALGDITRLTRLLTTLSEPGSMDELLDHTVACLSEIFAADVVALLIPTDPDSCAIAAAIGLPEDLLQEPMACTHGTALAVALEGEVCVAGASGDAGRLVDWRFQELDIETAIWVPMRDSHAAVVGVIVIGRCAGAPFLQPDIALLASMAHRVGVAVDQAQRGRQLEHLARSAQAIGHSLDEQVILFETVRIVPDVLRTQAAIIALLDQYGSVRTYAHSGLSEGEIEAWSSRLEDDLDVLATSIRLVAGQTFQIADVRAQPYVGQPWPANWRTRSVLSVPLIFNGRVQGVLLACRFTTGEFTANTVQLATLYATQVAAALENARLLDAVRSSDARFRSLIRGVSDVITILGANGVIRYASPSALATWGCASDDVLGQNFLDRVHPDDLLAARGLLDSVLARSGATLTGSLRLQYGAEGWRDFEVILTNQHDDPAVRGIITTCHDVTERKAFELQLSQLAFRDPLSGLPNRALFMDRLEHALVRATRDGRLVAVLFVDLDNFKLVNDTLGHAAGDAVLIEVAARLKQCLRAQDTAARLGGDEFTVLVEDIPDLTVATVLAERIQQALKLPIQLPGQDIMAAASIGIALSAAHSQVPDELLHRADLAMYRAKSRGKGDYAVFDASLNTAAQERLALETNLRRALGRGVHSVST
jgi:diguanylate cyclase (GGDEF)-like protein/PAS domain S-box-containing protein